MKYRVQFRHPDSRPLDRKYWYCSAVPMAGSFPDKILPMVRNIAWCKFIYKFRNRPTPLDYFHGTSKLIDPNDYLGEIKEIG